MLIVNTSSLKTLESWRGLLFIIAGVVFAGDLTILLYNLAVGPESQYLTLGQGLIGTAWTCSFLALLGFYPKLSERSKWLPRIGGVFAVIGLLTMLAMAVTSYGVIAGVIPGALEDYTMFFLPGVFLGIVLGFGLYGVASLRTTLYSQRVGVLFLVLVATFLTNIGTGIAGYNPLAKIIGVVAMLVLANLGLGYLVRTGDAEITAVEGTSSDSAA
jgi:hypothetical protein